MKYFILIIMVVLILSCGKNFIVEENYYNDVTPFEMFGRAYWALQYVDGEPKARVFLNAAVTQIELGQYENVWVHGKLKNGVTLVTISEDSSRLYNNGIYIERFYEAGQEGTAEFVFYTQDGYDNRPILPHWAMWVTYITQEGVKKIIELDNLEVSRFN